MEVLKMTWNFLIILALLISCHTTGRVASLTDAAETDEETVVGGQAKIPCGMEIDGSVELIRFRRGGRDTIYTFDVREGINNPLHRTNSTRMSFSLLQKPLHLLIRDITSDDQGLYDCSFFFERRKMYKYTTYLTVIVPPDPIRIYDSSGKEVDDIAGPFKENSTAEITCQVTGGQPSPAIKWWQGGDLLDEKIDSRGTNVLRNTLTVGPLTRSHLHAKYVCQASNTNLTAPIMKRIQLDVHYKPLTINITTKESPLVANEKYKIQCLSSGGRPPAVITWWLGKVHILNSSTDYTTDGGNTSLSTLNFTPRDVDAGKKLECRSESPEVEHAALNAHWLLDIYFAPKVNASMSSKKEIKEGDSVRLDCKVTSNPPFVNVTWYHKGTKVETNKWTNTKIENTSLVLSSVKRQMSGLYTCVASNQVGKGTSNGVVLQVHYIPVCSTEQMELVGASHRETVLVHCRLKALPKINSLRWQFNSSGVLIDIPEDQFIVDVGEKMSLLNYTIKSEKDYGTLLCWGKNTMGEQVTPCVFKVIEASLPERPINCTHVNQTSNTVFVKCLSGHDGGLPQMFVAEVFDLSRKEIIRNVSFPTPSYLLKELPSGTDFLVTIYSMNSKGSSEQQLLQVYTTFPSDDGLFAFPSTHVFPITPILGVLIGVVGALVLVAIIVVVVMRLRSGSEGKKPPREDPEKAAGALRDGAETGDVPPPTNETQNDGSEIPNKLKHANFYETPPTFKPSQNGGQPTENKSDDSDNLEYAELKFKDGKSKNKNKKKSSKANGKVHPSHKDSTIYASIDHVQTEKQKLINSKKEKDKKEPMIVTSDPKAPLQRDPNQKQSSKRSTAPSPPPSPPPDDLLPPPSAASFPPTNIPDQTPASTPSKLLIPTAAQAQKSVEPPKKVPSNQQAPIGTKQHRETSVKKSSGKPTNLDKPAIPKKPTALTPPELLKQKKKKTVETQTPDSEGGGAEGGASGGGGSGGGRERKFAPSDNNPDKLPLMEVTVESNL